MTECLLYIKGSRKGFSRIILRRLLVKLGAAWPMFQLLFWDGLSCPFFPSRFPCGRNTHRTPGFPVSFSWVWPPRHCRTVSVSSKVCTPCSYSIQVLACPAVILLSIRADTKSDFFLWVTECLWPGKIYIYIFVSTKNVLPTKQVLLGQGRLMDLPRWCVAELVQ